MLFIIALGLYLTSAPPTTRDYFGENHHKATHIQYNIDG